MRLLLAVVLPGVTITSGVNAVLILKLPQREDRTKPAKV